MSVNEDSYKLLVGYLTAQPDDMLTRAYLEVMNERASEISQEAREITERAPTTKWRAQEQKPAVTNRSREVARKRTDTSVGKDTSGLVCPSCGSHPLFKEGVCPACADGKKGFKIRLHCGECDFTTLL